MNAASGVTSAIPRATWRCVSDCVGDERTNTAAYGARAITAMMAVHIQACATTSGPSVRAIGMMPGMSARSTPTIKIARAVDR